MTNDFITLIRDHIDGVYELVLVMSVPQIDDSLVHPSLLKVCSVPKNKNINKVITAYFFSRSSSLTPSSFKAYLSLGDSKLRLTLSNYLMLVMVLMLLLYLILGS